MAHSWRWTLIPLLVALALFAHAIPGAGFVADDAFNLAEHARHGDIRGEWTTPTYAHAGGSRGHIWRPIPASVQHAFALALDRTGPVFRSLNLVIHLLNVFLIFTVARRWGAHHKVACLAALLWTTHASMADAVSWSSDIYDLMATSFMLVAVFAMGHAPSRKTWPAVALLLLAACLCKESSLALVPVLAVLAASRHGVPTGIKTASFASVGAGIYWVWHRQVTAQGYLDAVTDGSAMAVIDAWLMSFGWIASPPNRAYMAHLFDRSTDAHEVWIGIASLVLFSLIAADTYRRDRTKTGPGAAIVCAAILLLPAAIGIPFIGVAPLRYIYMPMALLISVGASAWTEEPAPIWSVLIVLICGLGAYTVAPRVSEFDNDITLWTAELEREPENPYAGGSLGRALIADKRAAQGIALWSNALENAPNGIRVFDRPNEQWLLAQTAFMKGHPDVALQHVTDLIEEAQQTGNSIPALAHCLQADSFDALGRKDEALRASQLCR